MELGSGSLTESGGSSPPNSSTESLNGLKFGQKIYFEDVGGSSVKASGPGSSSSSSSSSTSTTTGSGSGRKARSGGGVMQSGQPPRCQVEGCQVDLSDAKAYYSRHKVCSMHSKSAMVIVAGLQQRFCQQCSRFHQLPEFDQGKRSCRRRLAGHNERRRKPTPGSLLAARYGRLSSSAFESSSRGGFLVDFSAYPRIANRDSWPATRLSGRVPGNQTTVTARHLLPHSPWQNFSANPPSDLFIQGSSAGFSSPGIIPSGECFAGVSDSSCALSLLSNCQPWGSRNRASGLSVNDLMHDVQGASSSMAQPALLPPPPPRGGGAAVNQYPHMSSWGGFKGNEASGSSSHQMMHPQHLGLGSISQPVNSQFSSGLELSQQRHYVVDVEHSADYDDSTPADYDDSTPRMNWSL